MQLEVEAVKGIFSFNGKTNPRNNKFCEMFVQFGESCVKIGTVFLQAGFEIGSPRRQIFMASDMLLQKA